MRKSFTHREMIIWEFHLTNKKQKFKQMKNLLLIFSALLVLASCQPDAIPPIGEARDYKPYLTGTWNIVKVVQIDADAEAKGFPDFATRQELTNAIPNHPYTDFSITFNSDGTFTTDPGNSYLQFLADGTWGLNSDDYPSAIVLTKGDEIKEIGLGSLADVILGKVEFKEERKQPVTEKVTIKYIYSLQKTDE
jgi:hypothetical protein